MTEDRQKCLDAGCNDYLAKPIDRQKFLATVARSMENEAISVTLERQRLMNHIGTKSTARELLSIVGRFGRSTRADAVAEYTLVLAILVAGALPGLCCRGRQRRSGVHDRVRVPQPLVGWPLVQPSNTRTVERSPCY